VTIPEFLPPEIQVGTTNGNAVWAKLVFLHYSTTVVFLPIENGQVDMVGSSVAERRTHALRGISSRWLKLGLS